MPGPIATRRLLLRAEVVAVEDEDLGESLTTTDGKWSIMHVVHPYWTALPDAVAGLDEGQKAMMLGVYSEYDYV